MRIEFVHIGASTHGQGIGWVAVTLTEKGAQWNLNFRVKADDTVDFGSFPLFTSSKSGRRQYVRQLVQEGKVDQVALEAAVQAKWQELKPTFDFAKITQDQLALEVRSAERKVQEQEQALAQAQAKLAQAREALQAAL